MKLPPFTSLALALISLSPLALFNEALAENFSVEITTERGFFFSTPGAGGSSLDARPNSNPGQNEKFTLVDINGGRLSNGDLVFLKASSGHYVSAEGSGGRELVANRQAGLSWETFQIRRLSGSGTLVDGDAIALKTAFNKFYVSAENGGGGAVKATATFVGTNERLKLILLGEPEKQKLSAPMQSPALFMAPIGVDHDRDVGHNDMDCRNFRGHQFPTCYDQHMGMDFMLLGHQLTMKAGIDAIAAAPGQVIAIKDGFTDKCHFDPTASDHITCPGTTSEDANQVIVRQDDGQYAFYLHLKRWSVAVKKGDRVECGTLIGEVGSSGNSSAPHLHFEVRSKMDPTDEAALLPTDFDFDDVRDKTSTVDPYKENLWMRVIADLPKRVCTVNSPGSCFTEKTKLVCERPSQWPVCVVAHGALSGLCVEWHRGRCTKTCADACHRETDRRPAPCS